jgi:hypothetical protein
VSYVIYAKGLSDRFSAFVEELVSGLARRTVNISNQRLSQGEASMSVEYTDERGELVVSSAQPDIKVSYTASGGHETLKGAATGAAAGGGLGVLTSVLTGRATADRIAAGVAGAVTGGAYGAYRGSEKGMRDKLSFARLLAMAVTDTERRLIAEARKTASERDRNQRLGRSPQTEGRAGFSAGACSG